MTAPLLFATSDGPVPTMNAIAFGVNIACALLIGVTIGLERQFRQHVAGLRTNALVCVGAALFVSLGVMVEPGAGTARIASYVVSGLGFLGGGVILREGFSVRGLNTAATLWCTGAVGALSGAGLPGHAAFGAVTILTINLSLRPVVRYIDAKVKTAVEVDTFYRMRAVCRTEEAALIRNIFMRHVNSQPAMSLQGLAMQDTEQTGMSAVVAEIFSSQRNDKYMNDLVQRFGIEPGVISVSWERVR